MVIDDNVWIKYSSELEALREDEKGKLPYNFNVFDEIRVDENAHTRIFKKLLCYKVDGKYLYLQSFLKRICRYNKISEFPFDKIIDPQITFDKDHIDCLVEESSREYAVIIENKINGAIDQKRQIERYYERVRCSHGVREKNIYVIYLTLDGNKQVSSYSLPEWLRKKLGNRFIEMNYKNHVLPWLKEDILPEIKIKDVLIESGLRQYIDFLEGRLQLRRFDIIMQDKMNKKISEMFKLKDMGLKDRWNFIDKSIADMNSLILDFNHIKSEMSDKVINCWDAITREFFDKTSMAFYDGYYKIFLENIDDNIHFEWVFNEQALFNNTSYRIVLHVENDDNQMKMIRFGRNSAFNDLVDRLGFERVYNGWEIIGKDYFMTDNLSFSDFVEDKNYICHNFLSKAYEEVKQLKDLIEETYNKFNGEENCINDLYLEIINATNYDWNVWPEDKSICWDLATRFNCSTHEIGIEGSFGINKEKNIVFRSYITVWKSYEWNIYSNELEKKFSNCFVDKVRDRVYLHLPEVEIGKDLSCWENKKYEVVSHLKEIFLYMKEMTSNIGK